MRLDKAEWFQAVRAVQAAQAAKRSKRQVLSQQHSAPQPSSAPHRSVLRSSAMMRSRRESCPQCDRTVFDGSWTRHNKVYHDGSKHAKRPRRRARSPLVDTTPEIHLLSEPGPHVAQATEKLKTVLRATGLSESLADQWPTIQDCPPEVAKLWEDAGGGMPLLFPSSHLYPSGPESVLTQQDLFQRLLTTSSKNVDLIFNGNKSLGADRNTLALVAYHLFRKDAVHNFHVAATFSLPHEAGTWMQVPPLGTHSLSIQDTVEAFASPAGSFTPMHIGRRITCS